MKRLAPILTVAALALFATTVSAQQQPGNAQASPNPPAQPDQAAPTKVPKPKTRLALLRQMQVDLDMAAPHAHVEAKGRKKIDKCRDVILDATAQQQRYKSVNVGKINGCLKDLDTLLDAGAFDTGDREKLLNDSEKLGDSLGKPHRIRLPQPL